VQSTDGLTGGHSATPITQIHEEEEEIAREPSLAHGLYNSKPAQQQQQAKQAARVSLLLL
jgi:hypothetical protein